MPLKGQRAPARQTRQRQREATRERREGVWEAGGVCAPRATLRNGAGATEEGAKPEGRRSQPGRGRERAAEPRAGAARGGERSRGVRAVSPPAELK